MYYVLFVHVCRQWTAATWRIERECKWVQSRVIDIGSFCDDSDAGTATSSDIHTTASCQFWQLFITLMHLFNWLRKLWSRQTVKNKHTENKNRYAHTWCFQITWLRNNMTAPSNPAQTSISEAPTWCCRNGRLFNITRMQTLDTVMDDRAVAEAKGCHWQDLWWHETGWFACQWVGKTGWFVSPHSAFHRAQPTPCRLIILLFPTVILVLIDNYWKCQTARQALL